MWTANCKLFKNLNESLEEAKVPVIRDNAELDKYERWQLLGEQHAEVMKKRNITHSQCVVSSTQGSSLRERSLVMTAANLNGLLLELELRTARAEC